MSGHEKGRALALAAIMVLSVLATGLAFTGGAAAAPGDDTRTDDLSISASPDMVTPGDTADSITVSIDNGDDNDAPYTYTVTGPSGEIASGATANEQFTVAVNPENEGQITIDVTAEGNSDDNTASNTATTTVTSAYDLTVNPTTVASGDNAEEVSGVVTDDQGNAVSGKTLMLRDTDDDDDDTNNAEITTSTSDANGQVSFTFTPDQQGEYPITGTTGTDGGGVSVTYATVTVTGQDLTVSSDKDALLAGNQETVNFTVANSDGDQLTGDDLSNLGTPSITQNTSDVSEGNGNYADTDGDDNVDVYRVDIDADQSAKAPVNVTFENNTADGSTQVDVVAPQVVTDAESPGTKGVRTPVTISVVDPRDGSTLSGDADVMLTVDGGTLELNSAGEADISNTDGDVQTSDDGNSVEIDSDDSITFSEAGDDNDGEFNVNGTAFAYNASDNADDDNTLEQPVVVNYDARSNDDNDDNADFGDAGSEMFEALNGEASPDSIPLQGDSLIDVTTTDAQNDSFDRTAYLDGAGVDVDGDTGDDGQTTFSVNPDQTGTIDLDVGYDDEFVDGDTSAPGQVNTDEVEVNQGGEPAQPATVNFDDQTSDDGKTVTVDSVDLPNDGYVAIHNATQLNNGKVQKSVIGVSEYLSAGQHDDVQVTLFDVPGKNYPDDKTLDDGDQTLVAMPHKETNGNQQYNFITSDGSEDGAYTDNNGAVVDSGVVTYNAEQPEPGTISAEDSQAFGEVTVGQTSNKAVTVTNDGGSPVQVSGFGINVNQGSPSEFSVVNAPGNDRSFTLDAGESADITVRFAPGSTGPKTASLYVNTENDGSTTTSLTGSGTAATHTLRIDGTDGRTFYAFEVPGELTNTDRLTSEDTVRGQSVQGAVGAGADQVTFTGNPDDLSLYVDDGADVTIDGEEVDPDDYNSVIKFHGDGDYSSYNFAVNDGQIVDTDGLTSEDSVNGNSADGAVRVGDDQYAFTGTFQGVAIDGGASLMLNGQEVSPTEFYNTLTFTGHGSTASYDLSVSGEIANTQRLTSEDSVNGNSATGAIKNGKDVYVYSGTLDDLDTDGDVGVTNNGEEISANTDFHKLQFVGQGSTASYDFSVSDDIVDTDRLTSEDSVNGNSATGAIKNGYDIYYYGGSVTDLNTDGDVVVVNENGDEVSDT